MAETVLYQGLRPNFCRMLQGNRVGIEFAISNSQSQSLEGINVFLGEIREGRVKDE